jgi:hypothetical protein
MLKKILLILCSLFLTSQLLFAEGQVPSVRVINDEGKGVKSDISKADRENKEHRLGPTDNEGYKRIDIECISGEIIRVQPVDPNYYRGKCECPLTPQHTVKVTRKEIIENLNLNAAYFENSGEYAKAAMIYNEIFVRVLDSDEKVARDAEKKVYVLFGKALNNYEPTTYDPKQNKIVISTGLKKDIRKFQKINNISYTGNLDYGTLSKAAEAPIGWYIFKRVDK